MVPPWLSLVTLVAIYPFNCIVYIDAALTSDKVNAMRVACEKLR